MYFNKVLNLICLYVYFVAISVIKARITKLSFSLGTKIMILML